MCCPCRKAAVGAMRSGLPSLKLFLNPFASHPSSSLLLWRPRDSQRGRGRKERAKWRTQVLDFAAFWVADTLHRNQA